MLFWKKAAFPLFAKLLLAPNEDGKRIFIIITRHHTGEPYPPFGQLIARRHCVATDTGGALLIGADGLLAVDMLH